MCSERTSMTCTADISVRSGPQCLPEHTILERIIMTRPSTTVITAQVSAIVDNLACVSAYTCITFVQDSMRPIRDDNVLSLVYHGSSNQLSYINQDRVNCDTLEPSWLRTRMFKHSTEC